MSRIVDKPISNPVLDGQRRPLRFRWAGQLITVAVTLDRWVLRGRWWDGEPESTWWRVQSGNGGVYELYQYDEPVGAWYLYRILD